MFLPDQTCWDVVEGASFGDMRRELGTMTGMPVDVEVTYNPGDSGERQRGLLCVTAQDDDEGRVRIGIEGARTPGYLMARGSFVSSTISPGRITAFFGSSWISVSRVNLVVPAAS